MRIMTESEASKQMRVSPKTMYRLRQRGQIPFLRIGRKILYRTSDLEKAIERRVR